MEEDRKWSIRDVITLALMTMFLVVIQFGVNMICMVNNFISMVLSVGITMFLCGPVYFLMVNRVRRRFVSLIYMTLLGMIFLLMGNWFLLPWFFIVGLIMEAILWPQISPDRLTVSWVVFSLLYNGVNLLPVWFFWETYYQFAVSSGMEQNYIDAYRRYYTAPGWVIFIILFTVACGFAGSLAGRRLMQKHFNKAGVL